MPEGNGVPSRKEALSMLRITQPHLLMRDVRTVTGWDSLEALRVAVEELGGQEGATEERLCIPAGEVQALRACWQTGSSAGSGDLIPVVLALHLLAGDPVALRQRLMACTWQECTMLLMALQDEQGAKILVQELRWVLTSHWLQVYGHLKWGVAFGSQPTGLQLD